MGPYRYSPLSTEAYRISTLKECEVRTIEGADRYRLELWNLFWLSTPTIDAIPGSGSDWWLRHTPIAGSMLSIFEDVNQDDELRRALSMHPDAFADWWEGEDATIYDSHEIFGDGWHSTVMNRARLAGDALGDAGPWEQPMGNVIQVNFRRQA